MKLLSFPAALLLAVSGLHVYECGAQQVRIVKAERSPVIPDARVRIVSLKNGDRIFSMTPEISLEVSGYKLGVPTPVVSGKKKRGKPVVRPMANASRGQHVHVIVDNRPYKAIYDVSKPIRLKGVGAGGHTLVVFPSRSYHESIKNPGTAHIVNFSVLSSFGAGYPLDPSTAGVIYSRPKGIYKGKDAENILVDFYLYNTVLGKDGYTVKLSIFKGTRPYPDSMIASEVFRQWRPAFVEGLESGEYVFRIELIDPSGERVPGKFGGADRVIKVVL